MSLKLKQGLSGYSFWVQSELHKDKYNPSSAQTIQISVNWGSLCFTDTQTLRSNGK